MKIIYIAFLLYFFQSCSLAGGGGPCEGAPFHVDTYKTVGSVDLIDSTKAWIDSLETQLLFQNKKGNIVSMTVSSDNFGTNHKDIRSIPVTSECANTTLTYQYSIPVYQRKFQIPQLNFTLILSREKSEYTNYIYDSNDAPLQRAIKMGDELKIQMKTQFVVHGVYGDQYYDYYVTDLTIIPKDKWALAKKVIYDTLTVGGTLYQNVYYCYRDTSDLSEMKSFDLSIYPMGVYYAFNHGVIGFTLLNGDSWFRK